MFVTYNTFRNGGKAVRLAKFVKLAIQIYMGELAAGATLFNSPVVPPTLIYAMQFVLAKKRVLCEISSSIPDLRISMRLVIYVFRFAKHFSSF